MQTLKNGARAEGAETVIAAKEYPHPNLEQLNHLGELGELVYTKLDEPRYPEVVAVNNGSGVLLWWVLLWVELV